MTRRELLLLPGAGLLIHSASGISDLQNISYPLRSIQGSITAPNLFFVRDHFSEPDLSLESWKLRIDGRVDHPYELTFSDLVELPTTKLESVLECAGNVANGSAVSNGVWEGVPISSLLKPAQPASAAAFVMLEGADSGRLLQDTPNFQYSQVVPLDKCMDEASLVAFKLNDLLLPKRNGFPVRALFPGWYGMDSVKWLQRIVVMNAQDQQASTFYQSGMNRLYNRVTNGEGATRVSRLSSIQVKSAVAWPLDGLKLPAGRHFVWGFAWAGTGKIRNVAITTNGGKTWTPAKLDAQSEPHCWVRWSYLWNATPGDYILMSRASDAAGRQQPLERDHTRNDAYELNSCVSLRCTVR
ncbi:MAG: molybdopterin-dependent oxidoreductase [Bryobacteraceae bacterium]